MKVTYYVASSIDGYIAKEDGDVSWLDKLDIPLEETGYDTFYSSVDALVMGRNTYDMVCSFGTWPYGDKAVWVCTNGTITPIEGVNLQKETSPRAVVEAAKKKGKSHLWLVGGGKLASSFIENSLLANITLSQMPIILGEGIKLFSSMQDFTMLKLKACRNHPLGFAQIEYEIQGPL